MTKPSRTDRLIALGLAVGYVVALVMSADTLGYARDEGFYFSAARSYKTWFSLLMSDPGAALERANVDRYFAVNHEHPVLMKSLFALSHWLFYEKLGLFAEQGTAYRFPGMLMAGLAVSVIYLFGRQAYGRLPSVFAALSFALMPRMFYHAHLACFDMPVAAMWLVTAYAYFRSLYAKGLGWAVATGVLYGLLLNTKHNSWLLPPALIAHLAFTRGKELWDGLRRGRPPIPQGLVAMLVIGPPLFVLTWPWLWHDTLARFVEYVEFHRLHEYYNMEFLGHTYWKPPMPRLYAWVMTLATVPGITLSFFACGLVASAHFALRLRRTPLPQPEEKLRFSTDTLWLLGVLMSYAPWLSDQTPIFGGTKHWITAYPFLCLFAGRGFALASEKLSSMLGQARHQALARAGVFAAGLAGPLVMTLHSHPYGLTFYTPLVGGAPGAATLGLNRTFWGYTTDVLLGDINATAPKNAVIYVHDTALQSYDMLRKDGRVRRDLRPTLAIHTSQLALYHHEPHMGRVEYQVWVNYGTTRPAGMGLYDGVPVVWFYRRP